MLNMKNSFNLLLVTLTAVFGIYFPTENTFAKIRVKSPSAQAVVPQDRSKTDSVTPKAAAPQIFLKHVVFFIEPMLFDRIADEKQMEKDIAWNTPLKDRETKTFSVEEFGCL